MLLGDRGGHGFLSHFRSHEAPKMGRFLIARGIFDFFGSFLKASLLLTHNHKRPALVGLHPQHSSPTLCTTSPYYVALGSIGFLGRVRFQSCQNFDGAEAPSPFAPPRRIMSRWARSDFWDVSDFNPVKTLTGWRLPRPLHHLAVLCRVGLDRIFGTCPISILSKL